MTLHCSWDRVGKKELKRNCEIHGSAQLKDPGGRDEAFSAEGGRCGSFHQRYYCISSLVLSFLSQYLELGRAELAKETQGIVLKLQHQSASFSVGGPKSWAAQSLLPNWCRRLLVVCPMQMTPVGTAA